MTDLLHTVVEGEGPPLVLLGSLGSTLEMWEPNLAALAARFTVIRMDHLGHGGSPVPEGPYTMRTLADAALATLDDLGLDRVAWCGLSLGGMVGMAIGSEHPERLSRLALCCTTACFTDKQPWHDRIAAVQEGGTGPIAATVASRWFSPEWATAHPEVLARAVGWLTDTPDAGYLACCQAIEVWDHREELGAITAPTLVVGGADDLSTPVEPHLRTIAAGIPGAHLEVIPGGHLATTESAASATTLLIEHLAS
jgi:3-oxoadipate enol-lactonase